MANTSLVLELQRAATDGSESIADLLRKAKIVATKLKLNDFREWVDRELNGYGSDDVPTYRKARAQIQAKNPYHGLIPVIIPDEKWAKMLCEVKIRDPIGNLSHIVQATESGSGYGVFPLPDTVTANIMETTGSPLPPIRTVSTSQLATIIDTVRTAVLDWALKLEQAGVIGEGLTFSDEEKTRAATSKTVSIENFQGIFGDVVHSTVTQDQQLTVVNGDLDSLRSFMKSQAVNDVDITALVEALKSDPAPSDSAHLGPAVSSWIGGMVTKAASGLWKVTAGAASGILCRAICSYYHI